MLSIVKKCIYKHSTFDQTYNYVFHNLDVNLFRANGLLLLQPLKIPEKLDLFKGYKVTTNTTPTTTKRRMHVIDFQSFNIQLHDEIPRRKLMLVIVVILKANSKQSQSPNSFMNNCPFGSSEP